MKVVISAEHCRSGANRVAASQLRSARPVQHVHIPLHVLRYQGMQNATATTHLWGFQSAARIVPGGVDFIQRRHKVPVGSLIRNRAFKSSFISCFPRVDHAVPPTHESPCAHGNGLTIDKK